jgi:hypothetical protein
MRLLAAMFKHETNTFSPVPTPIERFFGYRPAMLVGDAAIAAHRGTGSALAGFIELAQAEGAELQVAVAGDANPSGPVEDDAYEQIVALSWPPCARAAGTASCSICMARWSPDRMKTVRASCCGASVPSMPARRSA